MSELVVEATSVSWLSVLLYLLCSVVLLIGSRQDADRGFEFGKGWWTIGALFALIALVYKSLVSKSWTAAAVGIVALCLEIAVLRNWAKSE